MSLGVNKSTSSSEGVHIKPNALAHFLKVLEANDAYLGVRLSLKKTGCSGLSYVVDLVETASVDDLVFPLDSTKYMIYIDRLSYPALKGIEMDYVTEGVNQKLIFINPNQTGECGCGESFTIDAPKD